MMYDEKKKLLDGMTGSKFLSVTRALAVEARSRPLTARERQQVNMAVEVFSPENFYMDGEL